MGQSPSAPGPYPACEAVLVEKGETSVKVAGLRVSRAHLVGQAKVSCHFVT